MRYNENTYGKAERNVNYKTMEVLPDYEYEYQEIQRRLEENRTRNKKIEALKRKREAQIAALKRKRKARIANIALVSFALAFTTVGISYTQTKDEMVKERGGGKIYDYATGAVVYSGEKVKSEEVFERMIQNAENTIEEIESKFDFSEGRGK